MSSPRHSLDIRTPDRSIAMTVGLRGPTALTIDPLIVRRRGLRYVADAVVALADQAADRLYQDAGHHHDRTESVAPRPVSCTSSARRSAVEEARRSISERVLAHPAFADDHRSTAQTADGLITVTVTAARLTGVSIADDDRHRALHRYPSPLLGAAIVSLCQRAASQIAYDRAAAATEILAAELGGDQ